VPARAVKALLAQAVSQAVGAEVSPSLFLPPPAPHPGDLALACFGLAKTLKKNPAQVAAELARTLPVQPPLAKVEAVGPYLNLTLETSEVIRAAFSPPPAPSAAGTVVVDFSSPNIAKHMAVYHLRSTMIGNALCQIHRALGFKVVGVNHLGDWGTGYGKLIVAWKRWWDPSKEPTVTDLNALYVRFGQEAKTTPVLEEEARAAFLALEKGDAEARRLWQRFRDISLAEFQKIYDLLGVRFDEVSGESVYEPDLEPTIALLSSKGLVSESEGALVVALPGKEKPCLLKKSDGATLYATRDIAAAISHQKRHAFTRKLYVVDAGQSLHFQEVFAVLAAAGFGWADRCEHVSFGILRFGGKRGRTREGGVVLLKDVLDEATSRALEIIRKNSPDLADAETVARQVGIGAVVFNDNKNRRTKDIDFDFDEALAFEGETGPYVQYAHVRACGILRKAGEMGLAVDPAADLSLLKEPQEKALAWQLALWFEALERASREAEPSVVAGYLLDLAKALHSFHYKVPVLKAEPAVTAARLRLMDAARARLAEGLAVLGIAAPEQM